MTMTDFKCHLTCSHTRTVRALESGLIDGNTVFCLKCWEWRDIVSIDGEWRWSCRTCHSGRRFGPGGELLASSGGRKHHAKFPEHLTVLMMGERVVTTWLPIKISQDSLRDSVDPPF